MGDNLFSVPIIPFELDTYEKKDLRCFSRDMKKSIQFHTECPQITTAQSSPDKLRHGWNLLPLRHGDV